MDHKGLLDRSKDSSPMFGSCRKFRWTNPLLESMSVPTRPTTSVGMTLGKNCEPRRWRSVLKVTAPTSASLVRQEVKIVGFFSNQLKHTLRRLISSPMFTVVTLATIGIGVGANAAIFSVINGILL